MRLVVEMADGDNWTIDSRGSCNGGSRPQWWLCKGEAMAGRPGVAMVVRALGSSHELLPLPQNGWEMVPNMASFSQFFFVLPFIKWPQPFQDGQKWPLLTPNKISSTSLPKMALSLPNDSIKLAPKESKNSSFFLSKKCWLPPSLWEVNYVGTKKWSCNVTSTN